MSELRADDPRRLGAYRISGRLGQGGQGVVYLGHSGDGTKVAVKLLHASLSADPVVRRRFLAEVEALRRVAPFCTAQLLDADLEGDQPYLVSEYVDGVSLREHVLTAGPRTGGSLHRLAIGTATALVAIHRAGVVHRDFKPGNVLLSLDGPRVIDFGVSRLADGTATTGIIPMGTPAYLAPERIEGLPAGPAADLYAWALTVAYTATGRHAFAGGTHQEVLARILYGRPDLGNLSGRLRGIVDACLARDPADRPGAEEVLGLLLGQDLTGGDVLTTGAMAAVDPGVRPEPDGKTLEWQMPDDTTDPGTGPTLGSGGGPLTGPASGSGGGSLTGSALRPAGGALSGAQVTEGGRTPGGRSRRGAGRSALAALVDPTAPLPGVAPSGAASGASSGGFARDGGGPGGHAAGDAASGGLALGGSASGGAASGGFVRGDGSGGSSAGGSGSAGGFPAVGRRGRKGRWPRWGIGVAAVVLAAVAGVTYWMGMDGATPVDGTWTGSARHPTAGRVFPVEIRLDGERESRMRWGADLHCTGELSPTSRGLVFTLGDVAGKECHPGTLHLLPTSDADRMGISVIRQGQHDVTYSGTVSRTP
ncbi:serine/threonine-protein kinase [Nonomuraea sp. NPDC023979]|uniref:serine/threonine-protein kinase n=1 Tax=Nonomuraea sp. NPDC023979 TaxID=3154796 RepID=UPI00340B0DAC